VRQETRVYKEKQINKTLYWSGAGIATQDVDVECGVNNVVDETCEADPARGHRT